MAHIRPERPSKFRPDNDCNGLVTGRRLGYMNERRLSDFPSGSSRHTAAGQVVRGLTSGSKIQQSFHTISHWQVVGQCRRWVLRNADGWYGLLTGRRAGNQVEWLL